MSMTEQNRGIQPKENISQRDVSGAEQISGRHRSPFPSHAGGGAPRAHQQTTDISESKVSNPIQQSPSNNDLASLARDSQSLENKLGNLQIDNGETTRQGQSTNPPRGTSAETRDPHGDPRTSTSGAAQDTPTSNDPRLVPAPPTSTESKERNQHDTTIHTNVLPAVIHETIRPIETTIITTERTVHHHIHHHIHRIQPVVVTSDEEEQLARELLNEGAQPEAFRARHWDSDTPPEVGKTGTRHVPRKSVGNTDNSNVASR